MTYEIRVGRFQDSAVYDDDQYMVHVAKIGDGPQVPLGSGVVRNQDEANKLAQEYASIYHAPIVRGVMVRGGGFKRFSHSSKT